MQIHLNATEPTVTHIEHVPAAEKAREFIRDFTRALDSRLMTPRVGVMYVTRSGNRRHVIGAQ